MGEQGKKRRDAVTRIEVNVVKNTCFHTMLFISLML